MGKELIPDEIAILQDFENKLVEIENHSGKEVIVRFLQANYPNFCGGQKITSITKDEFYTTKDGERHSWPIKYLPYMLAFLGEELSIAQQD